MIEETELAWTTISKYLWGVRTWSRLHRQLDPAYGVVEWSDMTTAASIVTWVGSEPRRAVPIAMIRSALALVDRSNFAEVQLALLMLILLFTFARSETPCPKSRAGAESFDELKHLMVEDVHPTSIDGRRALGVRLKAIKQDPRLQRPEALGGFGDWIQIGALPDDPLCDVFVWLGRVCEFHGRPRPRTDPFFVCAAGSSQPLLYREALAGLRGLLGRVPGCDASLYGLHSLRVEGYDRARKGPEGADLAGAHGGWHHGSNERYARFAMTDVLDLPQFIAGASPPPPPQPPPAPAPHSPAARPQRLGSARPNSRRTPPTPSVPPQRQPSPQPPPPQSLAAGRQPRSVNSVYSSASMASRGRPQPVARPLGRGSS